MNRLSRRALLLGGGLAAAGAAAAGLLARRRDSPPPGQPAPSPAAGPSPVPAGSTPSPSPQPPRGGTTTIALPALLSFDTFDALRSGAPPVVELLGRTHSRLLQWSGPADDLLEGDLAAARESPDALTLLLHIAPRARWHRLPPLDARPVTADDVAQHLRRALVLSRAGGLPLAQRTAPLLAIDRVEVPAADTVRLRLSRPEPLLAAALAAEFALVQAPELAEAMQSAPDPLDPALVVGSGPWSPAAIEPGRIELTTWTGGNRPPLLDRLILTGPGDDLARFEAGEVDEFTAIDRRDAAVARTLAAQEFARPARESVISSFAIDAPPWNNPELLRAISGALNRGWLADALFGGRALPAGPLPPLYAAAPSEADLAPLPGYHPDPAADARDARQRWLAAGGPALGTITIDLPAIFDPRYAASAIVIGRLNDILGPQFRPAVESYVTISRRVLEGYYGNGNAAFWFGWGPQLPSPAPREALLQLYGNTLSPSERAALLAADPADSPPLRDLQRSIAADAFRGVIPWVHQQFELFRRPGHHGPPPSPFWDGRRDILRYRLP
ncbi:ABC transporter substrate-binding protein [Tepidiforma sp.]|uniref:ABC transporter substrate-binding protein n=1 Tax=Tepidiforma sp. TaxID=2682230 RepID=UPI002ADD8DA6|nr:ABC transporter substrate-binding protein [Tepidiforma sp.]